jgi:hypothetical protein
MKGQSGPEDALSLAKELQPKIVSLPKPRLFITSREINKYRLSDNYQICSTEVLLRSNVFQTKLNAKNCRFCSSIHQRTELMYLDGIQKSFSKDQKR